MFLYSKVVGFVVVGVCVQCVYLLFGLLFGRCLLLSCSKS
jgi:hypothetical protein